jgi:perosamine synthetase
MYSITIEPDFGLTRDQLMVELQKIGIETRAFFNPMHKQPVFRDMNLFESESYPIAEALSQKGLYLPSSSGLTPEEITFVCDSIKKIIYYKR